jgi:hypothetical protein
LDGESGGGASGERLDVVVVLVDCRAGQALRHRAAAVGVDRRLGGGGSRSIQGGGIETGRRLSGLHEVPEDPEDLRGLGEDGPLAALSRCRRLQAMIFMVPGIDRQVSVTDVPGAVSELHLISP